MPKSSFARRRAFHVLPWGVALAVVAGGAVATAAQSLAGSPTSVHRQRQRAEVNDFTFLRTPAHVERFVNAGLLVRVEGNRDYVLNGVSFEVARPAVRLFLDRLSGQYRRACGEPLVVTSLTRPLSDQPPNASHVSVHPAGMAVDLRRPTNGMCRGWLESTLLSLERQNVIEATLEHAPPHFHVAVFPQNYVAYVAQLTGRTAQAVLATAGTLSHTVQRDDTIWAIAQAYGTTVTAIRRANGLGSSTVHPGDVLTIPAGGRG